DEQHECEDDRGDEELLPPHQCTEHPEQQRERHQHPSQRTDGGGDETQPREHTVADDGGDIAPPRLALALRGRDDPSCRHQTAVRACGAVTPSSTRPTIAAAVVPANSASASSSSRCCHTGRASALMSSGST